MWSTVQGCWNGTDKHEIKFMKEAKFMKRSTAVDKPHACQMSQAISHATDNRKGSDWKHRIATLYCALMSLCLTIHITYQTHCGNVNVTEHREYIVVSFNCSLCRLSKWICGREHEHDCFEFPGFFLVTTWVKSYCVLFCKEWNLFYSHCKHFWYSY